MATTTQGLARTFRTGTKKVFLPSHMVTFLAPKDNQLPTFARFRVPLTFNKFDLRDYLLHVYRTPVLGVRSQLRQQPIRRSKMRARVYRPPPIKTMTVELTKPFVWPRVPIDPKPWRSPAAKNMQASATREAGRRKRLEKTGFMPLQDEKESSPGRKELREEAQRLLKEGGWSNKRELDVRFIEKAEKDRIKAEKARAKKAEAKKERMKKSGVKKGDAEKSEAEKSDVEKGEAEKS
ncbi:hypothetical protein GGS21DRAFT_314874 [Xylaria nigripes]|nr:hypothetical protein GGS21DRAFT_314874 [Xylaria nigripes]